MEKRYTIKFHAEEITVTKKALRLSQVLFNMMEEDDEDDEDDDAQVLPLDERGNYPASPVALKRVFAFCEYHADDPMRDIPKPLNEDLSKLVSEFDWRFVSDLSDTDFFDVFHFADYLQIDPLIELCSAKLADEIRGKNDFEIMARFGIPPLSKQELDQLCAENPWVEE